MTSASSNVGISLTRAESPGSLRPRVSSERQAETSFGASGTLSNSNSYAGEKLAEEDTNGTDWLEVIDGGVAMNLDEHKQPILFASDSLPSFRRAKAKSHLSLLRTDSRHDHLSSYHSENSPLISRDQLQLEHEDAASQAVPPEGKEGYGLEREGERGVASFGTFQSSSSSSGNTRKITRGGRWSKKLNMKIMKKTFHHCKVAILTAILVTSIIMFAINSDDVSGGTVLAVTDGKNESLSFGVSNGHTETEFVTVTLTGPFDDSADVMPCNGNSSCWGYQKSLIVCGGVDSSNGRGGQCWSGNHSSCPAQSCKAVPLLGACCKNVSAYHGSITSVVLNYEFAPEINTTFEMFTHIPDIVPFTVQIDGSNLGTTGQVLLAAAILAGVYVLIIFEWVHRAMAAMLGSTAALAVLSMLQQRPTLTKVLELIEWNTIWLLFGMMILVALFSQSGFFDWSAVKMYKLARGKAWTLIFMLCIFAGIVSAFLDNVTTILLLTPVSIRLSQVLNLDPRYVLIAEVIFSNIGGTATAIGDPPNVIIVSSPHIKEKHIYFNEFTLHVFLGILFVFVLSLLLLRLLFCVCRVRLHNPEPQEVVEMKRELAIWQRTANRLPVVSLEERAVREALQAKAHEVEQQLKENFSLFVLPTSELWRSRLPELEAKYTITDKNLLLRSSAVLLVVIVLFFVSNLIESLHFDLGWIAIFGAITLLLLADVQEIEVVLEKVEWGTLVFFAGLFVLMELLAELGLINFIASLVVRIIERVSPAGQMTVAMLLILWVSALASAFIDNIPFTAAIIPVIVDVAHSNPCVSLRPLVWALALGACLGGNGTLIGASANVVCAGIAEQNGYRISFKMFFKIGFPMMLVTVFIAMLYLLICHTWIGWDIDNTTCGNLTTGA